jgi:drug/metabolite transporter (DMT)-like permease
MVIYVSGLYHFRSALYARIFTMHWFLIAIIGPLLWSIIHHADKFLLSKFSKDHGVGSIVLFSSLFPVVTLPFFAFFGPNVLSIGGEQIFVLVTTGVISALAALFYFYALEEEETSIVVPMYQLLPIFGYFLGIVVLGESIELSKILASLVVILGATILSFEFEEESGLKFKTKATALMVGASLLLALNDVFFKDSALENGSYAVSIFWNFVGYVLFGLVVLLLVKKYRQDFFSAVKLHGGKFFSINIFNEVLQTGATIAFSFALLLAPVALVLLVDAYQPLFVFLIGIFLTVFFPKLATERISRKHLFHKIAAIGIIILGSIFVYS